MLSQQRRQRRRRLDFPDLGTYIVTLKVTNEAGLSHTTTEAVDIDDILFVTFGDSSASGQGNPEQDPAWVDDRCHRSRISGPAFAARFLEEADPHTSLTYLNFGCSGASITEGILGPYEGAFPPRYAYPLEPQLDAAVRAICGGEPAWDCEPGQQRRVDIVTINIGVNDVGFSTLIKACDFGDCRSSAVVAEAGEKLGQLRDTESDDGKARCTSIQQRLAESPPANQPDPAAHELELLRAMYRECREVTDGSYLDLDAHLDAQIAEIGEVYITTYPAYLISDDSGEISEGCAAMNGISLEESETLTALGLELNSVIANRGADAGWWPLLDIAGRFRGHGYCATARPPDPDLGETAWVERRWFVSVDESFWRQGDLTGPMHPNRAGHTAIAESYLEAITAPKQSRRPVVTARFTVEDVTVSLPADTPDALPENDPPDWSPDAPPAPPPQDEIDVHGRRVRLETYVRLRDQSGADRNVWYHADAVPVTDGETTTEPGVPVIEFPVARSDTSFTFDAVVAFRYAPSEFVTLTGVFDEDDFEGEERLVELVSADGKLAMTMCVDFAVLEQRDLGASPPVHACQNTRIED